MYARQGSWRSIVVPPSFCSPRRVRLSHRHMHCEGALGSLGKIVSRSGLMIAYATCSASMLRIHAAHQQVGTAPLPAACVALVSPARDHGGAAAVVVLVQLVGVVTIDEVSWAQVWTFMPVPMLFLCPRHLLVHPAAPQLRRRPADPHPHDDSGARVRRQLPLHGLRPAVGAQHDGSGRVDGRRCVLFSNRGSHLEQRRLLGLRVPRLNFGRDGLREERLKPRAHVHVDARAAQQPDHCADHGAHLLLHR